MKQSIEQLRNQQEAFMESYRHDIESIQNLLKQLTVVLPGKNLMLFSLTKWVIKYLKEVPIHQSNVKPHRHHLQIIIITVLLRLIMR